MIRFESTSPAPETKPVATNATNTPKAAATNDRSANRRDKAAFNAYQRDYMRKRRAAASKSST